MKKVEAIFQGFKVEEVREVLANEKISRITLFEVRGIGSHQGILKSYRGARYIEDSAEVKIEIVADDDGAERIAELIVRTLGTGRLGDGEVTIVPIEQNFRLRMGQQGHRVPDWDRFASSSDLKRTTTSFGSYLKALRRKFHEAG